MSKTKNLSTTQPNQPKTPTYFFNGKRRGLKLTPRRIKAVFSKSWDFRKYMEKQITTYSFKCGCVLFGKSPLVESITECKECRLKHKRIENKAEIKNTVAELLNNLDKAFGFVN